MSKKKDFDKAPSKSKAKILSKSEVDAFLKEGESSDEPLTQEEVEDFLKGMFEEND